MPGTLASEYTALQVLAPVWLQKMMGWAHNLVLQGPPHCQVRMEGGLRFRPEGHPIPFPGDETEAKQKTRPGENQAQPARSPA